MKTYFLNGERLDPSIGFKDAENNSYPPGWLYLVPDQTAELVGVTVVFIEDAAPPQNIVPSVVSMRQARLALLQAGLLATVDAAVAAGGEADQITWEYATEVDRNSPLVVNMSAALNLSSQQLDNLFTLAATL